MSCFNQPRWPRTRLSSWPEVVYVSSRTLVAKSLNLPERLTCTDADTKDTQRIIRPSKQVDRPESTAFRKPRVLRALVMARGRQPMMFQPVQQSVMKMKFDCSASHISRAFYCVEQNARSSTSQAGVWAYPPVHYCPHRKAAVALGGTQPTWPRTQARDHIVTHLTTCGQDLTATLGFAL